MTATLRVWPNIDRSGVSLVVYAEDGVTVIPAAGGAIVPYAKYYRDLISAGLLCDHDPLGLSGDPITIPPITRVSAALVGAVTAQLSAQSGLGNDESVVTDGDTAPADGIGDVFRWIGPAGTVDGYRVKSSVGGNWQRSIDRARIDVRKFGARGNASTDCKQAINDAITWAASATGVQPGYAGRWRIPLFLPSGVYHLSDSPTIPGTNQHDVIIQGEGAYTDSVTQPFGSAWADDHIIGGTVLKVVTSGKDAFVLENVSGVAGSYYHRFRLRDLAVQGIGSGSGMGINMKIPQTLGDWGAGNIELTNVIFAGFATGVQMASYEPACHVGVRICGCTTGLRLGAVSAAGNNAGAACQDFHNLRLGGCAVALEILKAYTCNFWGGLWQGNGTLLKVPANGSCRAVEIHNPYSESYDKFIDCDPSVTDFALTIVGWYLASGNGALAPTGPCRIYGNGWLFDRAKVDFDWEIQGGTEIGGWRNCYPAGLAAISGTGALGSCPIDHPSKYSVLKSSSVSGNVTLDRTVHGNNVELNLTGNVTLLTPVNYAPFTRISVQVLQSGGGGFTVGFSGAWHRESAWSDAGNAGGNRAILTIEIDGGVARVVAFDQYRAP